MLRKLLQYTFVMIKLTNAISGVLNSVEKEEYSCQMEHIGDEPEYVHF